MQNERRSWKALCRQWDIGPASGLAEARNYTAAFPDRFRGWIVLADVLMAMGWYAEAGRALRRAGRLAPIEDIPSVWERWGMLYRTKCDLAGAERWFRKALSAKQTTGRHVFLGATLARLGRHDEAIAEHRAAIRLRTPGDPVDEAHLNLALVLRCVGEYEEAREHLKRALSIDPKYREARQALHDINSLLATRGMLANQRLQPTAAGAILSRRG